MVSSALEAKLSHNKQVVLDMIAAINAKDMQAFASFLHERAEFVQMVQRELESSGLHGGILNLKGRNAIVDAQTVFNDLASEVSWRVLNIAEADNGTVFTERVDRFKLNEQWMELRVVGSMDVVGGKIVRWRDYWDHEEGEYQFRKVGLKLGQIGID